MKHGPHTVRDDTPERRVSLLHMLRRGYLRVALIATAAVALALTLAAFLALRTYADHNLQLVARSIAYSVEAAVVFRDTDAANEMLSRIVNEESLASASVYDAAGTLLAHRGRADQDALNAIGDRIAAALLPQATTVPVMLDGRVIGQVALRGAGEGFVRFVFSGLAAMLVCLGLGAVVVHHLLRRMQRDILQPVQALTAVTQSARRDRAYDRRAPPARINEFHQLGEDFNALLIEIEAHQAHLDHENQTLSHQVRHDSLTGLPNRSYFGERLMRALAAAQVDGSALSVLYLDNDHFKSINDRLGHAAGDALLIEVARRVRAQLRDSDVVARLGGDEFAVLLAPLRCADDAVHVADKILASMVEPLHVPGGEQVVPSLSIGIAVYPDHGRSAEHLLRAADEAMYGAKERRRGSRVVYEGLMLEDLPLTFEERTGSPAGEGSRVG